MPTDPADAQLCQELVEQGKQLHVSIRHMTFNWSLGKIGKINSKTEATVKLLEVNGSPEKLAEIYIYLNRNDISRETFTEHLHALGAGCAAQEEHLNSDGRQFLTGSTFCPADIIWGIKILRLTECSYPFAQNFPALADWYQRIEQRPGCQDDVLAKNRFFNNVFRLKVRVEQMFGVGIQTESRSAA